MRSKAARRRDTIQRGPSIVRGPEGVEVGIDLTSVEPPDQNFEADAILVTEKRGLVSFHCEQLRGGSTRVAIEIRMAIEAFLQFYATIQQDAFSRTFWSNVERLKAIRELVLLPSKDVSAVPTATIRAQVAVLSNIGTDAEISFFAMSVMSLANLSRSSANPPLIRGVVRITCHTLVLAEALAAAIELGKKLHPKEVPAPGEG